MNIHLGYEIKTGHAVAIPLRHTAVIGLTQESGKTTTLEALISRSKLRALAFVTKRGEGSFTTGRIVQPYFADPVEDTSQPLWQYVSSLLETTLHGEKLRMQRTSIMKVCDASSYKKMTWPVPRSLAEVARNIEIAIPETRNGFEQSMLLQLREYFRMVMPELANLPKSSALELAPGLNIMCLDRLSAQMQALIIASCINWIRTREKGTITIIPEGWKFLGEGHSSPAMGAAEQLAREGGVLQNFLWLDSQDLVSILPEIRKCMGVFILGRQGEINEAERTIKHLPTKYERPRPSDIQTLGKGYFYVSYGERLRKCYVQPAWMDAGTAQLVAATQSQAPKRQKTEGDDEMWRERAEGLESQNKSLTDQAARDAASISEMQRVVGDQKTQLEHLLTEQRIMRGTISDLQKMAERKDFPSPQPPASNAFTATPAPNPASPPPNCRDTDFLPSDIDKADYWLANIWPLCRDAVVKDPAVVQVLTAIPQIEILFKRKVVEIAGDTLRGTLALLISEGYFDTQRKSAAAYGELLSRGWKQALKFNLVPELNELTKMGFLMSMGNTKGMTWKRRPGLTITKRTIEAE